MNISIFGGTTEGRKICEYLHKRNCRITYFVTTEYGSDLLPSGVDFRVGKLDVEQMQNNISSADIVVDATHPYAQQASQNIRQACENLEKRYLRLVRSKTQLPETVQVFTNIEDITAALRTTTGNIFLAIGHRHIHQFSDFFDRTYLRCLPSADVINACKYVGFDEKHLICMHGPFSEALNIALLQQFNCKTMVTKNSGEQGGIAEKIAACAACGVTPLVWDTPDEKGLTFEQVIEEIGLEREFFPLFVSLKDKHVLIVGGGKVAHRRYLTLSKFSCAIEVVAPDISFSAASHKKRKFIDTDIDGKFLVVAATNSREVNRHIGELSRKSGVFVSVADCSEECTFYFPKVVFDEELTIGITSEGNATSKVKNWRGGGKT